MDRHRGEDRFGNNQDAHHYNGGRYPSSGPPFANPDNFAPRHRSPSNNHFVGSMDGGGGGCFYGSNEHFRPSFDGSPRFPTGSSPRYPSAGGPRPVGGASGFMPNQSMQSPLAGQKRGFPFSDTGTPSFDKFDGSSFTKLFVGSVPRTATEEDIRPLFEDHGHVLEVALIRDKRTGLQQGCCFIKYASTVEADRAIRALHNQCILPGGVGPIQVRYADGERERLGTAEHKLFVGGLNRHATEKEVEEIFAQYGPIHDVYLMRDALKQSRGCGFVKYSQKEMATAAINGLNGIYTMRGCEQPLIVRFADPKRPRPGESRVPAFGGPEFRPPLTTPGIRPNFDEPIHGHIPPNNAWQPPSPQNFGQPRNKPYHHSVGNQFVPRPGDNAASLGSVVPHSPQISSQQKSFQSPQNSQPQLPLSVSLVKNQDNPSLINPVGPAEKPISSSQPSLNQVKPSSGQVLGSNGGLPSQPQVVQRTPFANTQQPPPAISTSVNQQQLPAQQVLPPNHQPSSQLAQRLSQQTQTLQASFQSSQHAFSQLRQQLQSMQPSNQPSPHDSKSQQPNWVVVGSQSTTNNQPVTTSAVPAVPLKCNWTEHTSPDGYKYYYNSTTGESKWEKPEEMTLFEMQQQQQQQPPSMQQNNSTHHQLQVQQSQPQKISDQFNPQPQDQSHIHLHQQSSYQVPRLGGHQNLQEHSYAQLPGAVGSLNDSGRMQQGYQQHAQDWMWKSRPAGN